MKAQKELERQKQLMREKESLIVKMKEEEDRREVLTQVSQGSQLNCH